MTSVSGTENRYAPDAMGLLIADKDVDVRTRMAEVFVSAGYNVVVTNSAASALEGVLKKKTEVVLLGSEFDEWTAGELVPLLKKCNPDLTIILISQDASLGLLRKVRREGIFYHALKPMNPEDCEEIRQAVQCAFENAASRHADRPEDHRACIRPSPRRRRLS
jgi:DNA-binding NtrC family response regulator